LAEKNNVDQKYSKIRIINNSFMDDSLCNYESDLEKNNSPKSIEKMNINNLVEKKNFVNVKDDYFK